jgi:preprotein translocase subunit SecE
MRRINLYFQEAFNELIHKVTWPTWKELQSSAIVVMVATVVISLIVLVMDISFDSLISVFYESFFKLKQ